MESIAPLRIRSSNSAETGSNSRRSPAFTIASNSAFDALVAGQDPRRIAQEWQDDLEKFQTIRKKYLIYK